MFNNYPKMLPNINEEISKKSSNKKKGQTRIKLSDKSIDSLESKKLSISKQQSSHESKKSVLNSNCDTVIVKKSVNYNAAVDNKICDNLNPSTSCDPRYNNDQLPIYSTNKLKSDHEKNTLTIRRPSKSGSTMWIAKLHRKSTRKNYQRKLRHYETLIKILVNTRSADLAKNNIIQHSLRIMKNENRDLESGNIIESIQSGDKETRKVTTTENNRENTILNKNKKEITAQNSRPKLDAGKSMEISKTGEKMLEKNVTASTSKYFENDQRFCNRLDDFDDQSTDRLLSIEKNDGIDSDATIPSKRRINEFSNSLNTENKIYVQEFMDPYEFDDSDVVVEEIISGTSKTINGRVDGSSRKKDLENLLYEDNPPNVNKDGKLSPKFGKPEAHSKRTKNHVKKRTSSGRRESGNSVICITSPIKEEKISKGSKTSSVIMKKDKIVEKISEEKTRNSRQSKSKLGSKHTGRYCTCKYKKLREVKTSAYAVPAEIECPYLNIRRGYGSRSTGVKPGQKIPETSSGRISSLVDEKKTKNFYSPLELKYSEIMKSKLDPDHVSKNVHNSSKGDKSVSLEKSVNKVSISNLTLSLDSRKNVDPLIDKKTSKSSKLPTFSNYSIPVSIEINMAKNKLRKRSLSLNLIQSKITRYFRPIAIEVQNDLNLGISKCRDNGKGNNSGVELRPVPIIESDVLLKNSEKLIYLKSYTQLQKPELKISRRKYLYDVISDNRELLVNENKKNRTIHENDISPDKKSDQSIDLRIIDDSNISAEDSVVPPSYSIFSNNDDDFANRPIIDMNKILDTQQREDLLAPWETVNIYEKINRWHEDAFE